MRMRKKINKATTKHNMQKRLALVTDLLVYVFQFVKKQNVSVRTYLITNLHVYNQYIKGNKYQFKRAMYDYFMLSDSFIYEADTRGSCFIIGHTSNR